jgi:hypothetical protein
LTRKILNNNDPGDSTHAGGNDFDYINNLLTGVDQSGADPVTMATTWQFKNQKAQFINPASTFNYVLNTGAITGTRNISLPALTADDTFMFVNAGQAAYGFDNFPSVVKDGQVNVLGNNTAALDGILNNGSIVGAGSLTSTYNTTEGMTLACATTATGNLNAGFVASATGIGQGRTLTNMRFTARQAASATTTVRQYVGLTSAATLPISDTPLANGDSGILVGYISTDANWQIFNNDGSGAAVKTQITGPIATDANFHTIDITIPAGGASATVTLDGTSVVVGSRLPATTTNLFYNSVVQTTTTTARTNTIRYIQAQIDR